MADNQQITDNLLEMYGRNDWMMRLNFLCFLHLSGLLKKDKDISILDCGCGMGHLIRMLDSRGYARIAGLDASGEMVEAAREMSGKKIVLADVVDMDKHFDAGSQDLIIISDLFHHLPSVEEWETVFRAGNTLLKEGGCLIIREPFPIFPLMLLYRISGIRMFHVGPLKARLQSFIEEDELMRYFFEHWPGRYREMADRHGFQIEKDFNWIVHRITTCIKRRSFNETW